MKIVIAKYQYKKLCDWILKSLQDYKDEVEDIIVEDLVDDILTYLDIEKEK